MSTEQTSNEVEQADGIASTADDGVEVVVQTPGVRLAQERADRGLSQKEVADKLHITIHYVNSVESDAYEKLPGTVFAKGYIRRYAELLELDVEDYMRSFDEFQAQIESGAQEQENKKRRASGRRNRNVAIASLLLFVGVFIVVWLLNDGSVEEANNSVVEEVNEAPAAIQPEVNNEQQDTEPVSVSQAPTVAVETGLDSIALATEAEAEGQEPATVASAVAAELARETAGIAAETSQNGALVSPTSTTAAEAEAQDSVVTGGGQAAIPTPVATLEQGFSDTAEDGIIRVEADGDDVLSISFTGESWVEVNDNSANPIYRDLLEAGDVLQITGEAPFSVLLGDAPFTRVTFNGNEIDVADDIRIDNSARLTVGL